MLKRHNVRFYFHLFCRISLRVALAAHQRKDVNNSTLTARDRSKSLYCVCNPGYAVYTIYAFCSTIKLRVHNI